MAPAARVQSVFSDFYIALLGKAVYSRPQSEE